MLQKRGGLHEETLGAPNPMPGSNQTWWLKEAFNLVGLIGFFGAIVPFAALMLEPSILPDVLFA